MKHFVLALIALLTLSTSQSKAQPKNTLRLWVDTITVDQGQSDVFLDVKYDLDVQKPPVDFNGYRAELFFGPNSAVNIVSVHFANTASRNIDNPWVTINPGNLVVVALGNSMAIDTANPVLFRIRVNVKSGLQPGDSAPFEWSSIQLSDVSGIDQVVYGKGFIVRRKLAEPVQIPDTVWMSSPEVIAQSDASFTLPVSFITSRRADSANVKHMSIAFDLDTSKAQFLGADPAAGVSGVDVQIDTGDLIRPVVFVQSANPIAVAGELVLLRFHSRLRHDTVCAAISNMAFQILNPDELVETIEANTGDVCIQGKPDTTTHGAVDSKRESVSVLMYPNPFTRSLVIAGAGDAKLEVAISDPVGRIVYRGVGIGQIVWVPAEASKGVYYVQVTQRGYTSTQQVVLR